VNPYDFVRIDWKWPPERRAPIWHHRLFGVSGACLYSGYLDVEIYVETPLFIATHTASSDPQMPDSCMQNARGEYIIPGSSLKGMLRSLVETLGNGCLALFDGDYERRKVDYNREVPAAFQRCTHNTDLCIACRIFGMLGVRGGIFQGKVNIGDAVIYPSKTYLHEPVYINPLMEPRPHHASFYLDESHRYIAGRKYYFHHSPASLLHLETKDAQNAHQRIGRRAKRYIQPFGCETAFRFRIDFTSLERDEFAALLFAVALEENMRHKLGYGKPLGLGTVALLPVSMTLIDYSVRYSRSGTNKGKTVIDGNDLWQFIYKQSDLFSDTTLANIAMEDLRRIWQWPPATDVAYYYPSKRDWFDKPESVGKRIADTKNVP